MTTVSNTRLTRSEYLDQAHALAKRGTDLPQSKLNPELVRQIRRNPNGWTAKRWAEELGVHVRTVEAVRSYKNWSHVL